MLDFWLMKYYKYLDEYGEIIGMRYVEADDDNNAFREVTVNGETCLASNIIYPRNRMFLAEKPYERIEEIEEIIPISKSEFDEAWNKNLNQNAARWLFTKTEYPVGTPVVGFIVLFYPQGTIVYLGNSVLGVADYKACRDSTEARFMYPKHKVTAYVKDYDELNQWLILDFPQVHAEEIEEFLILDEKYEHL